MIPTIAELFTSHLELPEPVAFAFMQDPDYRLATITNRRLSERTWQAAFSYKLSLADATPLVQRPLSGAQLLWLCNHEKRAGLLAKAVANTDTLTAEHFAALVATGVMGKAAGKAVVAAVLNRWQDLHGLMAAEELAVLAEGVGGQCQLLAFGHLADEATIRRWLPTMTLWAPANRRRDRSAALKLALARHPGLLPAYVRGTPPMQMRAAGHRGLTDPQEQLLVAHLERDFLWDESHSFRLSALIANPGVGPDVARAIATEAKFRGDIEVHCRALAVISNSRVPVTQRWRDVSDPDSVHRLAVRVRPSVFKADGRPEDAAELLANPFLTEQDSVSLQRMLQGVTGSDQGALARASLAGDPTLEAELTAKFGCTLASLYAQRPIIANDPVWEPQPRPATAQLVQGMCAEDVRRQMRDLMPDLTAYLRSRLIDDAGQQNVSAWRTALALLTSMTCVPISEWIDTTLAVL